VFRLIHSVANDWNITFSTYRLSSINGSAVVGTLIATLDTSGEEITAIWEGGAWNLSKPQIYTDLF
jgi:hypothetical protein